MPPTLRGIYHNLKESKYTISNTEVVFFFSSQTYLDKFMRDYQKHRIEFNRRLDKAIDETPLNMDMLADIKLYTDCEKRGFRAWLKGVDMQWGDLYKYSLRKMTEPETLEWTSIETPRLRDRINSMK